MWLFFIFERCVGVYTSVYFSSICRKTFGGVINGLVCGSFAVGDEEYCFLFGVCHEHFSLDGGWRSLFIEPVVHAALRIGF